MYWTNFKYSAYLFVFSMIFLLGGCNQETPAPLSPSRSRPSKPSTPPPENGDKSLSPGKVLFSNPYLSASMHDDGVRFTINKTPHTPVFIEKLNNNNFLEKDVNEISFDEFEKIEYVILPLGHWLTKSFISNPFSNLSKYIRLTRPNIWGFSLTELMKDKGSILFRRENELPEKTFPEISYWVFKQPEGHLPTLGKGGIGEVFSLTHDGEEYALKKNAKEFFVLEKLQFTRAVINIYGAFARRGVPHMTMEKGQESLAAMIKAKRGLSEDQMRLSINRFFGLIDAQNKLGLKNKDIKPLNMLMTTDGVKVIDISAKAATSGYRGSMGQLYARALLATFLSKSFTVTDDKLEHYYDEIDYPRERKVIASDDYLAYWFQSVCQEKSLSVSCKNVTDFDSLYNLFEANHGLDAISGKFLNRHDNVYQTGLKLPLVNDDADVDWAGYFASLDRIGPQFCSNVITATNEGKQFFYRSLLKKYENDCRIIWETRSQAQGQREIIRGSYRFAKRFNSENDNDFRNWVKDAFRPSIKLQTFKALAREHESKRVFQFAITSELEVKAGSMGEALLRLFNY